MRRRLAAALLLIATGLAQAGVLRIEGSLSDDEHLLLRYTPPEGVRELPLAHSPQMRSWWGRHAQAGDACTELASGVIRLRPGCTQAVVKLQPALLAANAHYEPAQALGQAPDPRGVLGYLGHYLTPLAGHGLSWRWQAPEGGHLLYQGRWLTGAMRADLEVEEVDAALALRRQGKPWLSALGAHQMVYLGRAPSLPLPQGRLVFDQRLDAGRKAWIVETLSQVQRRLSQVYGRGLEGPAGVMVSLSERPGYHGDTSDERMLRLRLPLTAGAADEAWLRRFVSHEVVHWWNAGVFRSDAEQPWLHEGHAEWMALLLGLERGWLAPEAAERDIERALNACLMAAADKVPSKGLRSHNRAAYDCGLSLILLAQAHASAAAPVGEGAAVARLASLHRKDELLDAEALGRWSGNRAFVRLLKDDEQKLGQGLVSQLALLGLADARPISDADLPPAASQAWLRELMMADCGGVSFYGYDTEVRLAPTDSLRCRSWPQEGRLQQVAGVPAFGQLLGAQAALAQACAKGGRYRLGFADGAEVQAVCPANLPAAPFGQLLKLRPETLRRLQALQ